MNPQINTIMTDSWTQKGKKNVFHVAWYYVLHVCADNTLSSRAVLLINPQINTTMTDSWTQKCKKIVFDVVWY
jgi:hypothetical protein